DAAARHRVLRRDAAEAPRAQVGALRHAPSALGTSAGAAAVFRALLRNVAPLGAKPEGAQGPDAVDARSRSVERCVPDQSAPAHAAADGRRPLHARVRSRAARRESRRSSRTRPRACRRPRRDAPRPARGAPLGNGADLAPCESRYLPALRYLSTEKVPGSIGAFGTTSSNAIVFVSPLVKVIFIVSSRSDVLSIHRSSFARFSLICFRF